MHNVKVKGSFETYTPYLDKVFDGGTKTTQFAKVKLGSEGLSMGQRGCGGEYPSSICRNVIIQVTMKKVVYNEDYARVGTQDPDNDALMSAKLVDFEGVELRFI